ncbi:MAG: Mrp/NBP35 family ATP-binding protein [Actinomycetia bacterium]|nr:Mrp/NBP35 family ATP-binding protein [Actinomycetes bacterium]
MVKTVPSTGPSPDQVMGLLAGVIDPELGSDIVDLGMVGGVTVEGGHVTVAIGLTTLGCPLRSQIQNDVTTRIEGLPGVIDVRLQWTELDADQKAHTMSRARLNAQAESSATRVPPTCKVLAVSSGKGGVGKSSVTVNLAAGLARQGFAVGVMDADIWGFSVTRMLGVEGRLGAREEGDRKLIVPQSRVVGAGHLEIVSMGNMVDDEEDALMWRGLMLNRAVQHFIEDVAWGADLNYLLIDMPPGTGDVQMGLARMLPRAEMLIVTTPARSAQKVAARAITMSRKSHLRIVGAIENMSAFHAPTGEVYELFGSGGGDELAAQAGIPLLGRIPIEAAVAAGADAGEPVVLTTGPAAEAFAAIVERIVNEAVPPVEMAGCSARLLDAVEAALDKA